MNFLAPLFLLGGLAVTLPIIFHLIRRTPVLQRRFSSLMFLNPSPPQLSRRSRLDKILLLLLRCLIIGLVAFAFARPFLRGKLPVETGAAPEKILFVLLDASASMRREGVWPEALARVREIVQRAGPADRMQIALFDRGVRRLLTFDEWSALGLQERSSATEQRLRAAAPTWYAGEPGIAVIAAAEELDGLAHAKPETPRQIIVVSDLQEGSRLQNLQGFEWPKGIQVSFQIVEGKGRNNASLHPVIEPGSTNTADARPAVRVSNSSESKREQFRLAWVRAETGAPAGNGIDIQVASGKSRVVRAPQRPDGTGVLRLALTGDDEPFDNAFYVAAAEPERVQVVFVGAPTAPDDPAGLYFYLRRALQETPRRTVSLVSASTNDSAVIPKGSHFVAASGELSAAQAEAVRKYVEAGGTALFVLNNPGAAQALAKLGNVQSGFVSEAEVKGYAMLEQIDFTHPIFAPFAEPRFSDFTKIHFWKLRRLETNALPQAQVLARFDNGAPALLEMSIGSGKLLVLTSGWQPADSQLALSTKFVPLLYSMLAYAGNFQERAALLTAGAELPARSGASLQRLDGTALEPGSGRWVLDTPGLFTVSEASGQHTIAVNLDPAESKTAPLDVDQLRSLGIPLQTTVVAAPAQVEKKRDAARAIEVESRQKLWRWVIVAALLFVLVETWFAARLSRPALAET